MPAAVVDEVEAPPAGRGPASLLPRLPSDAWVVLGGDLLSAIGSGLTLPFFVIYVHRVRGIDLEAAALALSALAAAGFVGNPLGGSLSDRFGPRAPLIGGLVLAAAGAAGMTLVRDAWHAFAVAGTIGLGAAVIWPSQDTLLATVVSSSQRSHVFSVRHATLNAGFGVGGLVAAAIVDVRSPSTFVAIYLIDAATYLAFVPLLLSRRSLRRPPSPHHDEHIPRPPVKAVLRDRAFVRIWILTAMLITLGYSQMHASFPPYATRPGGISAGAVGLAFAANTFAVVLLQLFVLKGMEGRRRTTGVFLVGSLWAVAWTVTLAAGQLGSGAGAVATFSLALVIFALGETFLSPTLPAMVNDLAPDELRGRYNGLYTLAWTTGFMVGPVLAGIALGAGGGDLFFALLAAGCLVAGRQGLRLRRLLADDADVIKGHEIPEVATAPLPITDQGGAMTTADIDRILELRRSGDYAGARAFAGPSVDRAKQSGDLADVAQLSVELARLHEEFGDYDEADAVLRRAIAVVEHGGGAPEALASLLAMRVRVVRSKGSLKEAREIAARVVDVLAAAGPEAQRATMLVEAARGYLEFEENDVARDLLERALAAAEKMTSGYRRDESLVAALDGLGTLDRMVGRYAEAEERLQNALALAEDTFGPNSLEVSGILNDLGIVYKFWGRFDDAKPLYERSLRTIEEGVGPDAPDCASLLHNLGGLEHARGEFVAAEPYARRSVEVREKKLGPDHVAVAADKAAFASILDALGRDTEAEPLFRAAIAAFEKEFGPDHYEVTVNVNNLAVIHHRHGENAEAENLFRRALSGKEKTLGPDHPSVAFTLSNLAMTIKRLGRLDESEQLFRRAIDILRRTVQPDHPALRSATRGFAGLLRELGREEDAVGVEQGVGPAAPPVPAKPEAAAP